MTLLIHIRWMLIQLFVVGLVGCDSPIDNPISPPPNEDGLLRQMVNLPYSLQLRWLTPLSGDISTDNVLMVLVQDSQKRRTPLPAGHRFQFFSLMPSMGHAMDRAGDFEEVSTGVYLNTGIRFNMPGDWRHTVWVLNTQNQIIEQVQWDDFF